jgi:hypothetical protein
MLALLVSCNRENSQTVEKSNKKDLRRESEICPHIDRKELQAPPTPLHHIVSTESINLKSKNHSFLLTAKLIADQIVDIEGVKQQIFKIETNNKFRNQEFYFAFPIKYNKYWSELKIYKNQKSLNIGFEDKTNIYYLYEISLHELEEANEGLVEIKSNYKKQSKDK